jgi:hypothetical protein
MSDVYICLVTWPDGTEGMLFPRPGNVPINTTLEDGIKDFDIAVSHLKEWAEGKPQFANTKVSLVKFDRLEVVKMFPEPVPVIQADLSQVDANMFKCKRCGRTLSHIHGQGYVCEYCAGIED